jgi:hypothetical protein
VLRSREAAKIREVSKQADNEGNVGFADLLIVAQNYGHSLAAPAGGAASAESADLLLRKFARKR